MLNHKYTIATFSTRVKAYIVDMFILYTPCVFFVGYVVYGSSDDFTNSAFGPSISVLLFAFFNSIFYYFDETPGRRAYNIKVLDIKAKKLSFIKYFLRVFLSLVSITIIIGILCIFTRKDKRSLHDVILKSYVVHQNDMPNSAK